MYHQSCVAARRQVLSGTTLPPTLHCIKPSISASLRCGQKPWVIFVTIGHKVFC
jgi:hypothetical protein